MPIPLLLLPAAKLAVGFGSKLALKAFFLAKMAGLKAFLAAHVGATAANVSVGLLATAAAAVFMEKHIKGNSDDDAVAAAAAKGVSYDVARGILRWMTTH